MLKIYLTQIVRTQYCRVACQAEQIHGSALTVESVHSFRPFDMYLATWFYFNVSFSLGQTNYLRPHRLRVCVCACFAAILNVQELDNSKLGSTQQ